MKFHRYHFSFDTLPLKCDLIQQLLEQETEQNTSQIKYKLIYFYDLKLILQLLVFTMLKSDLTLGTSKTNLDLASLLVMKQVPDRTIY